MEFYQLHNLGITNTFKKHKDTHKFTREQSSRNEKSIIVTLVTKVDRKVIQDISAKRNA